MIDFTPEHTGTELSQALRYLTNAIKKRCTVFFISDFITSEDFSNAMTIANRKHDVVAIQVYDKRETELPRAGLVKLRDAERGKEVWVDTSSRRVRDGYAAWWNERQKRMEDSLKKSRVDMASVATDEDFVIALMNLFKRRL